MIVEVEVSTVSIGSCGESPCQTVVVESPAFVCGTGNSNVDLSSYATISYVENVSGAISAQITASAAGVTALNGGSGQLNLSGLNGIIVYRSGQTIFISGLSGSSVSLTGDYYLASNPNQFANSGNLFNTGTLNNYYLLNNPNSYSNSGNLFNTGSVLYSYISSLSGQAASLINLQTTGGNLYSLIVNSSGEIINYLSSTGSNLNSKIDSLSGYLNQNTGRVISLNGLNGIVNILGLGDNYISLSGNTLLISGSGGGGDLSNYATIFQLTGVSGYLNTKIENSGALLYSLINAASAGVSSINNQSGSLTFTGAGNVSVIVNGQNFTFSGSGFDSSQFYSISNPNNYASSGTLVYLTGNQTISGTKNFVTRPTVNGTGFLLSGDLVNIVYTTGNQVISGNKVFATGVNIHYALNVTGSGYFAGDLTVAGHFQASSKSFLISHPTIENKKLQYGVLEGPAHSVYINGHTKEDFINFPDYWVKLIDFNTVTVNLTPNKTSQNLYIKEITNSGIFVGNSINYFDYFYQVIAERIDIPKLETEI